MTTSPALYESLTAQETSRLRQLERIVQEGLDSFLKVGAALAEIRDSRLYRATHDRFEDYCLDKWGLTLSRCNQIIHTTRTYDHLVAAVPQDAELLARTNEHTLRPLSRLAPELQSATWELIRKIEEHPLGTTTQTVVEAIKEAIASAWEEREQAPNSAIASALALSLSAGKGRKHPGLSARRSDELGNFCRWTNRVNTWDPEAIVLADDELCLERRLKAARQLQTFCEALIRVIEARLSRNSPATANA
jgi:hypothetical protein